MPFLAIPLLPLFAAVVVGLFGKRLPRFLQHGLPILGVGASFVLSALVLQQTMAGMQFNGAVYTWLVSGNLHLEVGFLIDNLSALMMVVVTFVSLMVHIYTIAYMAEDAGYARFFSYISLFTFAMLMLVMSNNFMQLFFGWEAVGLVSYLLIGFWFTRPTAIYANLKAFLVNRVGDFGFLLGIAVLFWLTGSLDYARVFVALPQLAEIQLPFAFGATVSAPTLVCILLFIGAMGKSAQVPLHVWLPDSMEGPTPISALIHAATMVTAGIFMVARMSPLFELSDAALSFILVIGAITALSMGVLGMVQNDIKRVIAYSTLSQLGYMTVALGASAYSVAIFHLMTHAFFKALLFLGAGAVIMAMHHQQDMRQMGGLRKYLPITWATMLIGSLALVGTPFFAGFYSKDSILEAVALSPLAGSGFAYSALLIGVFVSAFYSFRMLFLVFYGRERWRDLPADAHSPHDLSAHDSPHEPNWMVKLPLLALAIPSVGIGYWAISPLLYGEFFQAVIDVNASAHPAMAEMSQHWHHQLHASAAQMAIDGLMSLPCLLTVSGIICTWWLYIKHPHLPAKIQAHLQRVHGLLMAGYGFDAFNARVFAGGSRALGRWLWQEGDVRLIDEGIIHGLARLVTHTAQRLSRLQTGRVYHYAFAMMIGLCLLLTYFTQII